MDEVHEQGDGRRPGEDFDVDAMMDEAMAEKDGTEGGAPESAIWPGRR